METEAGCPAGNGEAGAGDTLLLTTASAAHDVSTEEHAWETTSYVLRLITICILLEVQHTHMMRQIKVIEQHSSTNTSMERLVSRSVKNLSH